jgi:hypothetical protein
VNFGPSIASGGDGLNLAETLQLMTELERTSGTASVHFAVTDDVNVFADLFVYRADAREIADQTAYNSVTAPGASGAIVLPANHPAPDSAGTRHARRPRGGLVPIVAGAP